jgi:GH24 family phage-related lysozyme (muramidase)
MKKLFLLFVCLVFVFCPPVKISTCHVVTSDPPRITLAETSSNYEDAIRLIKKYEKFSSKPYKRFGKTYIGYGQRMYSCDTIVELTEILADSLIRVDFNSRKEKLAVLFDSISDNNLNVVTLLAFNVGVSGVSKRGFVKAVNNGSSFEELEAEYCKFTWAGGRHLPSLLVRRKEEFKMWGKSN